MHTNIAPTITNHVLKEKIPPTHNNYNPFYQHLSHKNGTATPKTRFHNNKKIVFLHF